MKNALKILSWVSIVVGGLVIFALTSGEVDDEFTMFLGGGLFLAQGIIALVYIKQVPLTTKEQLNEEKYNEKV